MTFKPSGSSGYKFELKYQKPEKPVRKRKSRSMIYGVNILSFKWISHPGTIFGRFFVELFENMKIGIFFQIDYRIVCT